MKENGFTGIWLISSFLSAFFLNSGYNTVQVTDKYPRAANIEIIDASVKINCLITCPVSYSRQPHLPIFYLPGQTKHSNSTGYRTHGGKKRVIPDKFPYC